MQFETDIVDYIESNCQMVSNVKHPPNHSCDNGLLFSGTYIALLPQSLRQLHGPWFSHIVRQCEIVPGLLARYPGDKGMDSWDDLHGVATASYLAGLIHAKEVYEYGKKHFWFWYTQQPMVWAPRTWGEAWLRRFPGFVPYLKHCAGLDLTSCEQTEIALSFDLAKGGPGDTSGICLAYLRRLALFGKYLRIDDAIHRWQDRMKKAYPVEPCMATVYAEYFGPAHPFTIYGPQGF